MMGKRQRGVALITALLVVTLAVVAAAAMANRQMLDIRRTGSLLHAEQAWAYVIGAEHWAKAVLRRDLAESEIDTLGENWSTQPPVSFVEGGSIIGRLIDLQGRFNLNSLVDAAGGVNEANVNIYRRLLRRLELDEGLADTLMDWIDEDIEVRFPEGAEDENYLLLDTPYRAANHSLVDVSELRLVKGYTEEAVQRLRPHVTALPESTAINVNTAEAVLLSALAEDVSVEDGQSVVDARGEEGYENVDSFTQEGAFRGKQIEVNALDVQTSWFLMVSEAQIGQGRVRLSSLIQRTQNEVRVVMRSREFFESLVRDDSESGQ